MIHFLAFLSYIAAFGLWIFLLVRGARGRWAPLPSGFTAFAAILHGAALVQFWRAYGELPLVGPGAALSSLAFVGGVALVAVLPMREVARVALTLLPFVILLQGVALALGIRPSPFPLDFQGAGFVLHVALAFLGYQGLALAFAAGVLYLIQHHELKGKRFGRFFQFIPPLAILERVGRIGLWLGFVSLTLALAVGWAWTVQNRGSLEMTDPKVLWAVMSWFVFLGILGARGGKGRSEYRSALAAVVGFAVVIGMYLALRVTEGGSGLFL
ncbi:MAG: hypothetical protein EXR92_06300 [Gemmatimonadetes bacterium]|nr:hypothetical protein [Gemmatimonadota bacterium]